ncbi:hypothetical protein [Paludisphaera soli]|uniref:hypothetical protein n=1 Tax=Paludisphaera soli TaxID=2712865 RepID=UPI0013E9D359|nr:hypothetical protein [Paludisphaera soli]
MIWTRLQELVGRRLGTRLVLLALLAPAAPPASALAQGFGPDPFRPYNSQYDPYVFGVAPGALDPVGNPTLNRAGVRNANQFQNFLEGAADRGNRYDQANRAYDREYNRVYRPNSKADARFEARRTEISDVYFRYLRETDPRKRAALFKEYTQAQNRSARDLAEDPNARGARRGRRAETGTPPPPSLDHGDGREAAAAPPPALPGDRASRVGPSRRRLAPAAGAGTPPPPSTAPAPSEVLDRALRSNDASIPPPPSLTP